MDLLYLPYVARIESHLAFIVLILLGSIFYYFGKRILKFIIRKVRSRRDRVRVPNS